MSMNRLSLLYQIRAEGEISNICALGREKLDEGRMIEDSDDAELPERTDGEVCNMTNGKTDVAKKVRFPFWLAVCWLAVAVAGCSGDSPGVPTGSPSAPPTAEKDVQPVATEQAKLPFAFPLTGLPSAEAVKSRPYMVMVENSPQARPQSGLDQADIVYEILAEGEVTRFAAVFQSRPAKIIGPVRSIRPYFVEIGDGLDAVIVHAGWSQDAMDMLAGRKLSHLDQVYGDDAYYWRSNERKAPHNLYTSVDKMAQGAEARKFRKEWNGPLLSFAKPDSGQGATELKGQSATSVKIPYIHGYEVTYEYDAAAGVYKRFMEGQAHADKESGKQLTATNLMVLESKHVVLDKEGRRNVDVFGPGKGYILRQGKAQAVTWERKSGMIRAFADGKEVPLIPGHTWIQIVPQGSAIELK